jgi:uncharacterized protein (TIGR00369 family)
MTTYVERLRRDGRSANPFFSLMGIDVAEMDAGSAMLSMEVRPDMHNGVGWLQGGILAAIADEAMALALYPLLTADEGIATISESTSFIRGIRSGRITARGTVVRKGRRVAFCEAEVLSDDSGKTILSRSTAAFAITKK